MADEIPKPEELIQIDHRPPNMDWMETPIDIRAGMYCYASNPKSVEYVGLPNARAWNPVGMRPGWHHQTAHRELLKGIKPTFCKIMTGRCRTPIV